MNKIVTGLAVVLAAATGWAGNYGLIRNEASTPWVYGAITNASQWTHNASSTGTAAGGEGEELPATEDFYVQGSKTLYLKDGNTAEASTVFTGHSLTLGVPYGRGTEYECVGRVRHTCHGEAVTSWDNWGRNEGLILSNGYYRTYLQGQYSGARAEVYGKVRVVSGADNPFIIYCWSDKPVTLAFHGDFSSDTNAVLSVVCTNVNLAVEMSGQFTNYFGRVRCSSRVATSGSGHVFSHAVFGNAGFSGTLEIANDALQFSLTSAEDTLTVNRLELARGSRFAVKYDPETGHASKVVVTNELAFTGKGDYVTVVFDAAHFDGLDAVREIPLLSAPAAGGWSSAQFMIDVTNETACAGMLLHDELDEGTGIRTLYARLAPIVRQTVDDRNLRDQRDDTHDYTSSFDDRTHWSDNETPHPGAAYLVARRGSESTYLRTPERDEPDWVFPGEKLTLGTYGGFAFFTGSSKTAPNKNVTFSELCLRDSSQLAQGNGVLEGYVKGRVCVMDGSTAFRAYAGRLMVVDAELIGRGRIKILGSNSATGSRAAQTEITGLNTNFFGTTTVSLTLDNWYNGKLQFQTLRVSDQRNLGGPLAHFDYEALRLDKYGCLQAKGDLDLNDETRGVFVEENGQMAVDSGRTLTLRSQLTLDGTLHKTGAGTLAFGGPVRFFDGTAVVDAPRANSNLLEVAAGRIKPLSVECLNGVEMSFAAGTGLTIPLDAPDARFRSVGLLNVLTDRPFSVPDGGKLDVTFDGAPAFALSGNEVNVAVCTVTAAAAPLVRSLLTVSRPASDVRNGMSMSMIESVDPDSGNVTFLAHFERQGLLILFK